MTMAGAWVIAGADATPVNRDGITGGEEIRPADGDWASIALASGATKERGALEDAASKFGDNEGEESGMT